MDNLLKSCINRRDAFVKQLQGYDFADELKPEINKFIDFSNNYIKDAVPSGKGGHMISKTPHHEQIDLSLIKIFDDFLKDGIRMLDTGYAPVYSEAGEYIGHKPLDRVAMYNILHNVQLGLSCIQNYGYEGACRELGLSSKGYLVKEVSDNTEPYFSRMIEESRKKGRCQESFHVH